MQNHLFSRKSTIFLLLSLTTPLLAHAAGADGLFGDYFGRMTGPCNAGYVLTGFGTTPGSYGAKTCTSIATILATQFASAPVPAGQAVIGFNPDGSLRYGAVGSSDAPVGAVMAFDLASCPVGWLPANGTNGTRDLRGEFIRGLDNGRGVDVGRTLGSWQADMFKSHSHRIAGQDNSGVPYGNASNEVANIEDPLNPSAHFSRPTSDVGGIETRPRNVALLYCQKITSSLPSTNTGVTWANISGTSAGNVTLATTGNVGIGTSTPGAKLEVTGQVKITGGTPGLGKVLVSDASGLATWQNPAFIPQSCPQTGTALLSNTCYGTGTLRANTVGYMNTAIGFGSLIQNITGNSNTAIGYNAGVNLTSGNNNIAIGYNTIFATANGSNQLNIGNWIYGNGGNIGIGVASPTAKLDIAGSAKLTGTLTGSSLVATSRISTPELCIAGVCKTNWSPQGASTGGGYRNYYSAVGGKGTGYGGCVQSGRSQSCTYNYFETTNWTKSYGPTDDATLGWFPIGTAQKVDIRVADREAGDWPAIGTIWSFGPGQTYPFDTEVKVYEGGNNHLWLTVYSNGTLRYRGWDYSGGVGGVHIYTEAYY